MWFDVPFFQWVDQKQDIIDRVRRTAQLVAVVHPSALGLSYSKSDLTRLTGYDLIEVANGPNTAEELWDAALSSGRPVCAIADDDTHDITDPKRLATAWTMVNAPAASADLVIAALRRGAVYGVLRTAGAPNVRATPRPAVVTAGNAVTVSIGGASGDFTFVGQRGDVRATAPRRSAATYVFTPDDHYIRPVIRSSGAGPIAPRAEIDRPATWLLRAVIILFGGAASFALVSIDRYRR